MATMRRGSSIFARMAAALVLVLACWSAFLCTLGFTLAGSSGAARMPSSVLRRRWSIFEGFEFAGAGAQAPIPGEVGTRSQREVDEWARHVECSLPLGIEFEERDGGDIYIKDVMHSTDAWEQGVRPGSQLTMVSATFGEEMWTTRKVGLTQFMQVLNSRFGSTISLALEKEDHSVLKSLFAADVPKHETEEDRRRKANMAHIFEREEATLQQKSMWNLFS